jgi:hypothetical protein
MGVDNLFGRPSHVMRRPHFLINADSRSLNPALLIEV